VPTIPLDLPLSATIERDGIRLSIGLDRNPMPASVATWVTKTITNTADEPLSYFPCGEAMPVRAELPDPWRPGRVLPDPERAWKAYLLGQLDPVDGAPLVVFLPAGLDGSSSGCGDVGIVEPLAPGATLRERARWDGLRFRQLGPPPTSRLDLTGTFDFQRADPLPDDRQTIAIHLDAWIAGGADALLDPAEAVDVAISDPRLTAILAARDLRNGNEGVVRFDPMSGVYSIGMLESGALPVSRAHLTQVDARTGQIVGFVDRDWDYRVDGYP
jgi:hypothetical protein